jgi:hypothetical protein
MSARRSRPGLRSRLAALACLVIAGSMLLATGDARAGKSQWSVFEDHTKLVASGEKTRARTLAELKALGADTLRIEFRWREIAPSPGARTKPHFDASDPAAYQGALAAYPGFGQYDDLVRRANALGLRIIGTITGDAPRWATAGGKGGSFANANYKVKADDYADYARAVARRYAGNFGGLPAIRYFTIWNEPNHRLFLKPISAAPAIYRQLVAKGLPAIRAGGVKGVKVFVGETAPSGVAGRSTGPRRFIQKWLCLNKRWKKIRTGSCRTFKKVTADGFAHHPYGPPGFVSKRQDSVGIFVISRIADYIDRAAARGRLSAHLPIYDTEFGYQSNPPDNVVSTTPSRQARLINEKEETHYRYGRLKSYSQYLMYDDPPRKGSRKVRWSGFQTGLRFPNGKPKPAYGAYRLPIVVHNRGRGVYVWGRVRPGTGARFVQLYAGGGKSGPRIRTNSRGYFGVKRARKGKYKFKAYGRSSSKLTLIGTSRTASPI